MGTGIKGVRKWHIIIIIIIIFFYVREAQKLGNPKHTEGVGEQAAENNVWSCRRRMDKIVVKNFKLSTLHLLLLLLLLYQLE